jgi:ATP-dependent phosphofructokinase / diphosphate-dependent phosphofructokinase
VRIGLLTGGGDCPGLNAVIRAIVRRGEQQGDTLIGFKDAWKGVMARDAMALTVNQLRGMLPKGGTMLGTTRGSPFDEPDGVERVRQAFEHFELDALIVIGGNGSLTVAHILASVHGLPIVGVPKTIDNDIVGTDLTFGFTTAVQVATDAIDRLHTTAESHDRVIVVEVMGRQAGWIATHAGIAGGATAICIPERPFDLDQVAEHLRRRHERGRFASIVVVAEGAVPTETSMEVPEYARDKFGHLRLGGIASLIAPEIEERTGFETKVTILGHIQRGGTPCAFDRVLSTRFGIAAVDLVHDGAWDHMVALRGSRVERVPLDVMAGKKKELDLSLYDDCAAVFFG